MVFADAVIADKVIAQQHTIDRREVEAKRALPKDESPVSKDQQAAVSGQKTKKIFVGGLAATVDDATLKTYFEQYGAVEDAVVMYDHENRRPRGFGFITFAEEEAVEKVFQLGTIQVLNEKQIEIKRAVPRESMSHSPRTVFRPQQVVQESRFQHGGPMHSRRMDRELDKGSSPRSGLSVGAHPDSVAVRSKALPQQQDVYSPPMVVTGIPAGIAVPGSTPMALGSAAVGQMGSLGSGRMIGVPQPNVVVANTALRNQTQYHSSNFPSNGMHSGPSHLSAMATPPPFRLDEQGIATSNFAELQQQMALNSVNEALEQLHVHQTHQSHHQTQPQQRVQPPAQQAQPPPPSQTQTTIWS